MIGWYCPPPPAKNILLSSGEDIETAINKLNNSTNTNKTKIDSLETSVKTLNNSIDTLNKDLSDLKKSLGDAAYLNIFRSWDTAGQSKSYVTKSTFEVLATQLGDGVTEVGQYIDMHTKGRNTDYDKRIQT